MNIPHSISHPTALRRALPLILLLVLLALPWVASAQAIDPYPVDNLLARFQGVLGNWSGAVYDAASRLFWALATISLTWTFGMMVFRRADFGELFAELVRFIVLTGIFWWLLSSGGGDKGHIDQILKSMGVLGSNASGSGVLSPASLLKSGYEVFFAVANESASNSWKDADKIIGLAMASAVLALVALAAVSMMIIKVMMWVLSFGGLFLLGFGGARWTSGIAINYYKHVLAVGISYFVMLLLAGTGQEFLHEYSTLVAGNVTLPSLAIMLVASIVLVALLVRIPNLVASIVVGSRIDGATGTSFSGHVMSLGGSAVAAGMGVAGQGAQAVYAAYRSQPAAPADLGHMAAYVADHGAHSMPVMPGTLAMFARDGADASSSSAFAPTASAVDVARAPSAVARSSSPPVEAGAAAAAGAAAMGAGTERGRSPAPAASNEAPASSSTADRGMGGAVATAAAGTSSATGARLNDPAVSSAVGGTVPLDAMTSPSSTRHATTVAGAAAGTVAATPAATTLAGSASQPPPATGSALPPVVEAPAGAAAALASTTALSTSRPPAANSHVAASGAAAVTGSAASATGVSLTGALPGLPLPAAPGGIVAASQPAVPKVAGASAPVDATAPPAASAPGQISAGASTPLPTAQQMQRSAAPDTPAVPSGSAPVDAASRARPGTTHDS